MILTFSDMQTIATESIGYSDAANMVKIKRNINIGSAKLLSALERGYNRKTVTTNIVASQQYYQLAESTFKVHEVVAYVGGNNVPLERIASTNEWKQLNYVTYSGQPTHYYVRGNDEIGLYPIPTANVTDGLEFTVSPRHVEMTQDDYTTGTVTVVNANAGIEGSGTTWTSKMVGQYIQVTDGTDGNWYRITEVTDADTLVIENYYEGTSGASKTYRIGQTIDFPGEFAEAPADYAAYRFHLGRGSQESATFKNLFDMALQEARERYSSPIDSSLIKAEREYPAYNPFRGDASPSIS